MNITSFNVTIGGVKHLVSVFGLDRDAAAQTPKRSHRMMILDRSYSMQGYLEQLVAQAKDHVLNMPGDDLVSVLYFSGPSQFGELLVGATPGQDVVNLLNTMTQPIGATCFSEVLERGVEITMRLKGLVDQTVVDMFTDGQPVVPWGSAEERGRAMKQVEFMVQQGVNAFNTIGYGPYYNRDFLNDMSGLSDHGVLTHASEIGEFKPAITFNMEVSRGLVNRSAEVHTVEGADILYQSLSNGGIFKLANTRLNLRTLDANSNYIFVVGPEAEVKGKHVTINEDTFELGAQSAPVAEGHKEDFLYAYAAELFRRGDHLKAVDILANNVRDKALASRAFNAFTVPEIGMAQNRLTLAARGEGRYEEGKTGPGFMPARDALCVMDVFEMLFKSEDDAYWLPFAEGTDQYQRIGRKATDNEDRFTPDTSYEVRAPLNDFVWNKEKLNLSVRFTRNGKVKLNPRSADRVELPHEVDSYIWRTYTFVKDGNVNIKRAEFLLPENLAKQLADKGVKLTLKGGEAIGNHTYTRAVIDFSKLPIVNRTYIDRSNSPADLHAITTKIVKAEAAQKVVKYVLDRVMESSANMDKTGAYTGYNAAQIQVLEEHGIRKDGSYGGVDIEIASAAESDSYEARFITFALKGAANLPSVEEMIEMKNGQTKEGKPKKPNLPGSYMIEAWDKLMTAMESQSFDFDKPSVAMRDFLRLQLKNVQSQLAAERNALNQLKLAKVLVGDTAFQGIEPNSKGEFEYSPSADVKEVMLIKLARKPVYID